MRRGELSVYSPEHIERAKKELLKQFNLLCGFEYGKLTLNANMQAKSFEVVLETHHRVKKDEDMTKEKI